MEEYETKEFLKMLGHDFDNNNKEYIKKYAVKCATGIATNGVPAFIAS